MKRIIEKNKCVPDHGYIRRAILEVDLNLIRENNELKLQLKEAEKHVCLQPDDKCIQRLNPNDLCRLRKILRGGYREDHPDAIITEEDMKREKDNGLPEEPRKG